MGGPARRGRGRGRRGFGPTSRRSREAMEATPVLDELDELSIMELRDELEEEGLDEDAIDAKCDALRTKLLEEAAEATPVEADRAVVAAQPGRAAQDPPGETLAHTSCSLCLGQCLAAMCMMVCCGDCG